MSNFYFPSCGTFSSNGKRLGRKPLSPKIKEQIKQLFQVGKSVLDIVNEIDILDAKGNMRKISESSVRKILRN